MYELNEHEYKLLEILAFYGGVWDYDDLIAEVGEAYEVDDEPIVAAIVMLRGLGYLYGGTEHCQASEAGRAAYVYWKYDTERNPLSLVYAKSDDDTWMGEKESDLDGYLRRKYYGLPRGER